MTQADVKRQTPQPWFVLEPAMDPNYARTDHGMLKPAGAGLTLLYPKGQILMQKNDGSNVWAKIGTSGYNGAPRILKNECIVDENGNYQLGPMWHLNQAGQVMDAGSVDMYYRGYFECADLVGAGGVNEVQTETLNVNVDGGTRKWTFMGYQTPDLAWDANNATLQAALIALPPLETGDVVVSGTSTQIMTFGGNYAGANVPLIVLDPALLTDGGVPLTTGSAIVETTPGSGLLTGVGRLIRGTLATGIMALGEAEIN